MSFSCTDISSLVRLVKIDIQFWQAWCFGVKISGWLWWSFHTLQEMVFAVSFSVIVNFSEIPLSSYFYTEGWWFMFGKLIRVLPELLLGFSCCPFLFSFKLKLFDFVVKSDKFLKSFLRLADLHSLPSFRTSYTYTVVWHLSSVVWASFVALMNDSYCSFLTKLVWCRICLQAFCKHNFLGW